jgi:hypothetical protein
VSCGRTAYVRPRAPAMSERPRVLEVDLLGSYARERDIDVRLERHNDDDEWLCLLSANGGGESLSGSGRTAREAVKTALQQAGVELPG